MSVPMRDWFQPGEGIAREVISADIQRYLGRDATVRPGYGVEEYEGVEGYWIKAHRNLTSAQVEDLKRDSRNWLNESRGRDLTYPNSSTYQTGRAAQHQHQQHSNPSQYEYAQPTQPSYSYQYPQGDQSGYTHQQAQASGYYNQANQWVPTPGYAQQQPRTAPTYTYQATPSHGQPAYQYAYPQTTPTANSGYPPQAVPQSNQPYYQQQDNRPPATYTTTPSYSQQYTQQQQQYAQQQPYQQQSYPQQQPRASNGRRQGQ